MTDAEAPEKLMEEACSLIRNEEAIRKMEKNIGELARTDAAGAIVEQVYAILDRTNTGEKK